MHVRGLFLRERYLKLKHLLVDCARFPKSDVGVRVMQCWDATIDIDGEILGILDSRKRNRNGFIGQAQFLQHDVYFGRVDTLQAPDFERFKLFGHVEFEGI